MGEVCYCFSESGCSFIELRRWAGEWGPCKIFLKGHLFASKNCNTNQAFFLHEILIRNPHCLYRYVGEIITDAEADKRENDSFLFTLDNKVNHLHISADRMLRWRMHSLVGLILLPSISNSTKNSEHKQNRYPVMEPECDNWIEGMFQILDMSRWHTQMHVLETMRKCMSSYLFM